MESWDLFLNGTWFSGCEAESPKAAIDTFKKRFYNILDDPNAVRDWYVSRRINKEQRGPLDPKINPEHVCKS